MSAFIDSRSARQAIAELPEGTSYGDTVSPESVHIPPSHLKALDPNTQLVTGMRGAGKTFWWKALQSNEVRARLANDFHVSNLAESTRISIGFGIRPGLEMYPDRDTMRHLLSKGARPRQIWKAVHALQIASDGHPFVDLPDWTERVQYVEAHPEEIARTFEAADAQLDEEGVYSLTLFDALDLCAFNWADTLRLIRGLLQAALDARSHRRIRMKVFLRSDQFERLRVADFPDASKILASSVELRWPPHDLYGLLWTSLMAGSNGHEVKDWLLIRHGRSSVPVQLSLFERPPPIMYDDDLQRARFHELTGPWMGTNRKRGFPYTWLPNHLADTNRQVSPRSFLHSLRSAADKTSERYPNHKYALHYNALREGVADASRIRVVEIGEDYPWVERVMAPLNGLMVPCPVDAVMARWTDAEVLSSLESSSNDGGKEVRLPPRHLDEGQNGILTDLERLGVLYPIDDHRINIPDVYRIGFGLGRKGGIKPAR